MYNLLLIKEKCPRCGEVVDIEAEFKMGMMNMHTYKLGDTLEWATGQAKPPHQKRELDGNVKGEGYVCCPKCNKDFWVIIKVEHDTIVDVKVDSTKEGYLE